LRKKGHQNIVFSRKKDFTDGSRISDVNKYKNAYKYTKVSELDRKFFHKRNSLFFYLNYILKISWEIKKLNIKKIIVFQTFSFCFWLKLINPNSKIIFHIGSHELSKKTNYYNYGFVKERLAYKVFPKIDKIVTVSNHITEGIIKRFPGIKEKVKTIYVGIDTETFSVGDYTSTNRRKIEITYTGRVVPEKGIDILVNAFNQLRKDFKDIELNIVGGEIGPNIPIGYRESLKSEKIKFLGLLARKELIEVLKKTSIFVYPVIMEDAFGLAPIEAMAMGLPTVVSDSNSGYREIINDDNGFYFKKEDEEDLERVLRKLIQNIDLSREVGEKARETVQEKLSWEECINKTMQSF
jgi:glycosyltransferase involved in cell wall biosynthesis